MSDTDNLPVAGGILHDVLCSLLPGLYFLTVKQYVLAFIHMGLFAGLFWGFCWAMLFFDLSFWYSLVGFLAVNGLIALGLSGVVRNPGKTSAARRFLVYPLLSLVVLAVVLVIGAKAILQIRKVASESMVPTLQPGDYILVNRYAFRDARPQKGQIVMFRIPADSRQNSGQAAVKRVAAAGGDRVYWRKGALYVNGSIYGPSRGKIREHEIINEYLRQELYSDYSRENPYIVPDNRLFLVGDNYDNSYDSRHHGPVKTEAVLGKVTRRIWPAAGPVPENAPQSSQ